MAYEIIHVREIENISSVRQQQLSTIYCRGTRKTNQTNFLRKLQHMYNIPDYTLLKFIAPTVWYRYKYWKWICS